MPVANFSATRKAAEDAGLLGGGDYYKYKEGDNRLRLMSPCLPHNGDYKGKPNFKWLCYVLDRRDGKVKVHFMPHKVYKAIEALQLNPDYAFEEVPMSYDITIAAKGAGTKEVEYSVIPARKEIPLTRDERDAFEEMKSLEEVQSALHEKAKKRDDEERSQAPQVDHDSGQMDPITDDDIPF